MWSATELTPWHRRLFVNRCLILLLYRYLTNIALSGVRLSPQNNAACSKICPPLARIPMVLATILSTKRWPLFTDTPCLEGAPKGFVVRGRLTLSSRAPRGPATRGGASRPTAYISHSRMALRTCGRARPESWSLSARGRMSRRVRLMLRGKYHRRGRRDQVRH